MADQVIIMPAEQYFEVYAKEAICERHMDRDLVKSQIVDRFYREMFGVISMRIKPYTTKDEIDIIIKNVKRDFSKKWIKLIKLFDSYKDMSRSLLRTDDFDNMFSKVESRMKNTFINEGTAEQ